MTRTLLSADEQNQLEHRAITRLWASAFRTMLPEAVRAILAASSRVRAEQGEYTEDEVAELLGDAVAVVRTFLFEHPRPLGDGTFVDHGQILAATILDCLTNDEAAELALVATDRVAQLRVDPFGEDDPPILRPRPLRRVLPIQRLAAGDLAVAHRLAEETRELCPDCLAKEFCQATGTVRSDCAAEDEPEPDGAA